MRWDSPNIRLSPQWVARLVVTATFVILVSAQLACAIVPPTPVLVGPTAIVPITLIQMPGTVRPGDVAKFAIQTTQGVTCSATVTYQNRNTGKIDKVRLGSQIVFGVSTCRWTWGVPGDTQSGQAEFHVSVDDHGVTGSLAAQPFTIENNTP